MLRIVDHLGVEACAEVVGRSVNTVYDWSNPEREREPRFDHMLALDTAWLAAGLPAPAPILDVYQRLVAKVAQAAQPGPARPHPYTAFLATAAEWGALASVYAHELRGQDVPTATGRRLVQSQACKAIDAAHAFIASLDTPVTVRATPLIREVGS